MSSWAALCESRFAPAVRMVARGLDAEADVSFAASADDLRAELAESPPGAVGALVGPSGAGVSDINLAAALVRDGRARCVVLSCESATGSLRSRAARAGIDLVVDLSEAAASLEEPDRAGEPGGARAWGAAAAEDGAASPGEEAPLADGARMGDGPSAQGGRAPVITVTSGRGGVGKTALAAVLASRAALWGMRVSVLDLDLSCGNLYSCFGLPHGLDLVEAAREGSLPEGLRPSPSLDLGLWGPCEMPEAAELVAPGAGELVCGLAARSDLVVVDTSTTFTDAVAQAVQLADRVLAVTDGAPGSVASLARAGGLAVRLGVARTRMAWVQNRARARGRDFDPAPAAEDGLEAARSFRVPEGGDEVRSLLASGGALELADSGLPFADSVGSVLAQLLVELGRLPDCDSARRAARGHAGVRRGFLSRLRG